MKKNSLLFVLFFVIISCRTSNLHDLGRMPEKERNAYLISLGKEVTKAFGPGYYREYKEPIISEPIKFKDNRVRPEIVKHIGRKYYRVTFLYDHSKETLDWNHASQVDIWKDTGEPMGVIFGNGYGVNFFFHSYKELIHSEGKDSIMVPYQQAQRIEIVGLDNYSP